MSELICYKCFREYSKPGPCPQCGFDISRQQGKYPLVLCEGTVLGGRYIVGCVLGQGGFGVTYAAQDYDSKKIVAIKEHFPTAIATRVGPLSVQVISEEMRDGFIEGKQNFLKEAQTLSQFNGLKNICDIYSYFEENGTAYFVMEYVNGIPLDKYMKELGRPLSFDEALRLLVPVMNALSRIHAAGIIHRDLAPDNIMVDETGNAMLIDFGAARYSMGEKSRSLDVILKHGFAPREQYARHGRQGAYTDVYALAATFYYAICGRVPPDAIDRTQCDELVAPSKLDVKIPHRAEQTLMKALAVDYTQRFQSMPDFMQMMAAFLPEQNKSGGQNKTKKKTLALVAAIVALAMGAGIFFSLEGKLDGPVTGEDMTLASVEQKPAETPAPTEEPDYINWELGDNGTLTISGKGAMDNYSLFYDGSPAPWCADGIWENIRAVVIKPGVTSIGNNAFAACSSLEEITIAHTVSSIGDYAFMACSSLGGITIPNSITSIGHGAFFECNLWQGVEFAGTEQQWQAVEIRPWNEPLLNASISCTAIATGVQEEGLRWTLTNDGTLTISGKGTVGGYSSLNTNIKVQWLECYTQIRNIYIEEGITSIGFAAFSGCSNVVGARLPASVEMIHIQAFNGCNSLQTVKFGGSEEAWESISVESGNRALLNADVIYNS